MRRSGNLKVFFVIAINGQVFVNSKVLGPQGYSGPIKGSAPILLAMQL